MNRDHWCDVVALLPPTAAECMSVPISRVRRWLAQGRRDCPIWATCWGSWGKPGTTQVIATRIEWNAR